MTYYEELGVPPDAASDTIREAYRNVARLLHPDAQTNPVLIQFAEVQMKRINHLYEVLSDPERRRRYDQELAGSADRPGTIIIQAPPSSDRFEHHANSGTFVWLAATAICAAFIIWLATRESSAPAVYPQSTTVQRVAAAILPKGSDRQRDDEMARLRAALAAANADRESLIRQLAALQPARKFQPPPADKGQAVRAPAPAVASLTPAPLAAQAAPLEISLPSVSPAPINPPAGASKPKWAGSWDYHHPKTENKNKAICPPEFIQTVISEENGVLRGEYHARFKVSNARISPDVDFRFEGKVSGTSGRFLWTGTGGAKGEVQLRLVSETTLQVAWTATSLGKSMGLISGTAELSKRGQ